MGTTIRVSHLIAALETLEDPAKRIPMKLQFNEERTPLIYGASIRNVLSMLRDEEHFDPNDPIIEINSVG